VGGDWTVDWPSISVLRFGGGRVSPQPRREVDGKSGGHKYSDIGA